MGFSPRLDGITGQSALGQSSLDVSGAAPTRDEGQPPATRAAFQLGYGSSVSTGLPPVIVLDITTFLPNEAQASSTPTPAVYTTDNPRLLNGGFSFTLGTRQSFR
jgi:hypothetical protein